LISVRVVGVVNETIYLNPDEEALPIASGGLILAPKAATKAGNEHRLAVFAQQLSFLEEKHLPSLSNKAVFERSSASGSSTVWKRRWREQSKLTEDDTDYLMAQFGFDDEEEGKKRKSKKSGDGDDGEGRKGRKRKHETGLNAQGGLRIGEEEKDGDDKESKKVGGERKER
jgi:hypothetical protein